MTLQQFLTEALAPVRGLRRGQAFMNHLYRVNPELYGLMTLTENDPFYEDGLLWKAVQFATEHWTETRQRHTNEH